MRTPLPTQLRSVEEPRKGWKGPKIYHTRPTGVYGPRCIHDVSYYFITHVLKGRIMSKLLPGDGDHLVHFTHVEDVVNGHLLALEKESAINNTYIIASDEPVTYNRTYEVLARLGNRNNKPIHVPVPLAKAMMFPLELSMKVIGRKNFMFHVLTVTAMQQDRYYSNEKARRELRFAPKYGFESGMANTIKWYRENRFL